MAPTRATPGGLLLSMMSPGLPDLRSSAMAAALAGIALGPGGRVVLRWNSFAGRTYRVEYSRDMPSTVWTQLGNNVLATNSTASATDVISAIPQRFYRVVRMN